MKNHAHLITNPFAINGIIWLVVIIIYNLKWSDWYPPLTTELSLFLYVTSLFSIFIGILTTKAKCYVYKEFNTHFKDITFVKKSIIVLYILLCIEFIACKQIPIFSILFLRGNYGAYQEFGLPIIHVLIVSGFIFIYAFSIYYYINEKNIIYRKKIRLYILLCIICGILIVNRALLMHMFCIFLFIFLMSKKNIISYVIKLGIISIGILFLFGIIGNIRNSDTLEAGKQYILQVGNASTKFRESKIPVEFFWGYLYISSPLSNVQYTINHNENHTSIDNLFPFIINNLLPQMISKRIGLESKGDGLLINENLNVGSVYLEAYAEMGWIGIWIMYIFTFPFVWFTLKFITPRSKYYIPCLAIINTIITFNIFNNMFIFSGIVPSLYFPIILRFSNFFRVLKPKKNIL